MRPMPSLWHIAEKRKFLGQLSLLETFRIRRQVVTPVSSPACVQSAYCFADKTITHLFLSTSPTVEVDVRITNNPTLVGEPILPPLPIIPVELQINEEDFFVIEEVQAEYEAYVATFLFLEESQNFDYGV